MQKPISAHTPFFTSLKHLEKRLKLENNQAAAGPSTLAPPPPPPVEVVDSTQQTDSLGTPIYLCDQSATDVSFVQESEAPHQFLSSPDHPPTNHAPPHEEEALERAGEPERLDLDGDIELLMQLLRLSDAEALEEIAETDGEGCDEELYERIVGVKGPKTWKEFKRLDGWIEHFLKGEKNEAFRLAHLLLGKAAFLHRDGGLEGLVYPSTIDEFLKNEPPID